jgi:glycosyltransferase involved in cell wall biosynthesis
LSNKLKRINFVTYGREGDRAYENNPAGIRILSTRWFRYPQLTIFFILLKYLPQVFRSDILKTNQIFGSQVLVFFKRMFRKKIIIRCGFLYSHFVQEKTEDSEKIRSAIKLEKEAFSSADIGIVSTAWMRDIVLNQYNVDPQKIRVIPNYVVTDIFKPDQDTQKKYDLVFVGRGEEQKNLDNLFKAISNLNQKQKHLSLLMVGGCCSNREVRDKVRRYAIEVSFQDNVPNFKLPEILNQSKVFILPSHYEGHPKALLEAMSCGLPCIGTHVTGIREDIEHMKTGFLCETDYESIADAIDTVLADEALQKEMGKNAREYIKNNYDVEKILKMELDVMQEIISS